VRVTIDATVFDEDGEREFACIIIDKLDVTENFGVTQTVELACNSAAMTLDGQMQQAFGRD
jgi:hypothetical protein